MNTNPWLGIWYKPKEVFRDLAIHNPAYMIIWLSSIMGIDFLLSDFSFSRDTDSLGVTLGSILLGGSLYGIIMLFVYSYSIYFTGKLLGGLAGAQELRLVVAWSNVPILLGLIISWIPTIILFGNEIFLENSTILEQPFYLLSFIVFSVLNLIFAIWSTVIMINGIMEVQNFSVWKAIGNLLFSSVFILIIMLILLTFFTLPFQMLG